MLELQIVRLVEPACSQAQQEPLVETVPKLFLNVPAVLFLTEQQFAEVVMLVLPQVQMETLVRVTHVQLPTVVHAHPKVVT